MELEGKRCLITGGTAGIGLALARQLAERGARVMICGRDGARLDDALRSLPGASGVLCDVGRESDLRGLVEETDAHFGGLDLLVNNAGIQLEWELASATHTDAIDCERIAREVAVNLVGPMQLTVLALPLLRHGEGAAIVNVTSVLARQPRPAVPVYSSTKAALRSWTRSLRAQLAPEGIRVVELVPPLVETAMTRGRAADAISAEAMASAAIRGLTAGHGEVRVGKARAAAWLDRLAPALLARMMAQP
ncbi:MAG: SDR family NAD(P)-dependent oxidoreductase [Myxococcales bacterium]|nr:SDR family NAD(P)-dependent oxidoreductase [Myxococcales bacterium]